MFQAFPLRVAHLSYPSSSKAHLPNRPLQRLQTPKGLCPLGCHALSTGLTLSFLFRIEDLSSAPNSWLSTLSCALPLSPSVLIDQIAPSHPVAITWLFTFTPLE